MKSLLNDIEINFRIESELNKILEEKSGETLIYSMIETSRDLLTKWNFPEGNRCSICLYELTANDDVVRNECFHHLHCRCFAEYVVSTQRLNCVNDSQKCASNQTEIAIHCPVCRIQLNKNDCNKYCDPNRYSVPYLSKEPLEDESNLIEEAILNQKKLQTIYEKQLKNGGIIDETQRINFVLRISETNDQLIVS